jgi:FAD/FMN-containing dehydrogenase
MIDIEAALASHARAIPTGSCATVGIGGLALGGGVGFASRAFGTTADNVLSFGIATADGRHLICSRTQHRDLFWACRGGGGGNFGIVTHFVFRTHPVGNVSTFSASWPWAQASEVVRAWQAFAPHAPDGLFQVCALQTGAAPDLRCIGQYLGPEARLRTLIRPLTRVDGIRLSIGTASYLDTQLRWAGCSGKTVGECHLVGETLGGQLGRATFAAKSDYLKATLSPAAVAAAGHWIERAQGAGFGSAAFLLDSYGGAINRVAPGATAFVHRDALASAQYLAYWSRPSDAAAATAWLRGFHAAMRPHVSGFAYQNYIDRDLAGWRHAYYGANYQRLRAVKRSVDPDWFFRFPQAIEPA